MMVIPKKCVEFRLNEPTWYKMFREVYNTEGICPCIHSQGGGSSHIKVVIYNREREKEMYR